MAAPPLPKATQEQIDVADGRLFIKEKALYSETYADILKRHGKVAMEAKVPSKAGEQARKFSRRGPRPSLRLHQGLSIIHRCVHIQQDARSGHVDLNGVIALLAQHLIQPRTFRGSQHGGGEGPTAQDRMAVLAVMSR